MASVVRHPHDECPRPASGSAVTIGAYDGVHLGHRAVIAELRRRAADRGLESAVITFDQHPARVVRPESAPLQLTALDQEIELLAGTGVDHVVVLTFDEVRAKESAEEFVHEVLVGCLAARLVIVGEDFHFGHERRGNVALLRELGRELGFEVEGLALVGRDGEPADEAEQHVSSTAIRRALVAGDLAAANAMLGRPHEVRGVVRHGDRRGREWGFPTANVEVPDECQLPADGIYAALYERPDGSVHPGAASLGRRPTIYDDQPYRLLEVHLLDGTDFDLYDEPARVRFVERLRGEERFETIESLVAQIAKDCDDARRVLAD
ncbi:MAG: bifunctional riboflavin kinase/FAD synthetase [Actinomycetota bacterium]|nr:bifunctional riboflavin kinase/FAD synthetase [Acidimicrobiia bacterium]MDQ3293366.1 bifunctional riboflavin kinase/FAD synthetase [Actinomycetota bacterium]